MTNMRPVISDTDIAAYIDGRLSGTNRHALEELLVKNDEQSDEFLSLCQIAREVEQREAGSAPAGLLRKAREGYPVEPGWQDLVIGLYHGAMRVLSHGDGIRLSFDEAMGSLRAVGSLPGQRVVIRKSLDELDTELIVERTARGLFAITVNVTNTGAYADQLRIELIADNRIIASELLARGRATFEAIGPGRYSVLFRIHQKLAGEITMKITEPPGEEKHD